MSILTKLRCGALLLCLLFTRRALAQPGVTDTLPPVSPVTRSAYDSALSLYHTYLAPEPGLFRGSEYVTYDIHLREGNPYYGDKKRRPGTIIYDGVLYKHILLLYDEVKDILILFDATNLFKINLFSDAIDRFTIENHQFIRLRDSLNRTQPRNGFYEVLYEGRPVTLLKKEKKTIREDLYSSNVAEYYIQGADTSYYLKQGNVYYPVRNTKSLLHALKDRNRDIRKFIRSNGLSMRKDRENTLLKVTAWYDTSAPH